MINFYYFAASFKVALFDRNAWHGLTEIATDYAGFDFYINMSNIYLDNEIVNYSDQAELIMEQYKIGMSLIGMSMIHSNELKKKQKEPKVDEDRIEIPVDEKIEDTTKSLAPILIPMINELAELPLDD